MDGLKYVSKNGEFIMGVPARDLAQEEIDALPEETRALLDEHVNSENVRSIYKPVAAKTTPQQTTQAPDQAAVSKEI